jgi:hypothetical protein
MAEKPWPTAEHLSKLTAAPRQAAVPDGQSPHK